MWVLEGRRRLISQVGFTESSICQKQLEEYRYDCRVRKKLNLFKKRFVTNFPDIFSYFINSYIFVSNNYIYTNHMESFLTSQTFNLIVILFSIITIAYLGLKYGKTVQGKKLHICYICGICILVIIELITYICVNNGNSTDIISYISFASTLSSLLLSVVAIIYAIVSNNKGEVQYAKIDAASDRISQSVNIFSIRSEKLSSDINSILLKLEEVKSISTDTREAIISGSGENFNNQEQANTTQNLVDNIVNNYISYGSFIGNLSLLACVYSKELNIPFNADDILLPDSQANSMYIFGYIIASSALGIVTAQNINNKFQVIGFYQTIKPLLIKNLIDYIKKTEDIKVV